MFPNLLKQHFQIPIPMEPFIVNQSYDMVIWKPNEKYNLPQNHNANKNSMQNLKIAVPERIWFSDTGFFCRFCEYCLAILWWALQNVINLIWTTLFNAANPVITVRLLWRPNVYFTWSLSFIMIVHNNGYF